jgi:hypothetical protein
MEQRLATIAADPVHSPGCSDSDEFCPECGQPLDLARRGSENDSPSSRGPRWGLITLGLLLVVAVVARTWSAHTRALTLEHQIQARAEQTTPTSPGHGGTTVAGTEEDFRLLADLVAARNSLRQTPYAVALALAVLLAGLGTNDGIDRSLRRGETRRGPGSCHRTLWRTLPSVSRRLWMLLHGLAVAITAVVGVVFGWSVGVFLLKGVVMSQTLLDAALSRTIDAVIGVVGQISG